MKKLFSTMTPELTVSVTIMTENVTMGQSEALTFEIVVSHVNGMSVPLDLEDSGIAFIGGRPVSIVKGHRKLYENWQKYLHQPFTLN